MRVFLIAFGALALLVGGMVMAVNSVTEDLGRELAAKVQPSGDQAVAFLREANLLTMVGGAFSFQQGMQWQATVTVVDVEGHPVPGADVWIEHPAIAERGVWAVTDRLGGRVPAGVVHLEVPRRQGAVFTHLSGPEAQTNAAGVAELQGGPGAVRVACAASGGRVGESIALTHDASGGGLDFRLRVRDGVTRRGRLRTEDGRAVEGFVRATWRRGDRAWFGDVVQTDAAGGFELLVHPEADHITSWLASGLVMDHAVAPGPADIELEVPRLDRHVEVRVRDADGQPVAAAIVSLGLAEAGASVVAACDGSGIARVHVSTGLLRFARAESVVHAPAERAFPAGDGIELAFPPQGVVTGVVRNGATGEPVADAVVVVRPDASVHDIEAWGRLLVRSDREGRYRLEGVPLGRHLLDVSHRDFVHEDVMRALLTRAASPPASSCVDVVDGRTPVTCDLSLVPGVVVRGQVTPMEDASPCVYITTDALLAAEDRIRMWGFHAGWAGPARGMGEIRRNLGQAGSDEHYEVHLLPDISVRLGCAGMVYVGPFAAPWTPAEVPAGSPPLLDVVLGAQVVGIVARPDGTRVEGARLDVVEAGGGEWVHAACGTNRTSVDGAFWIGWLPPGPAVVRISVPGEPPVERDIAPLGDSEIRDGVELIVPDP
ncbi:MAG: carboxypeptidase regulatory-like domain-containing protein [Planctomycetes bacterium]|nr:carboxypeptidase regulatory-like domain-containing protein [Planctomycetota bacterium]